MRTPILLTNLGIGASVALFVIALSLEADHNGTVPYLTITPWLVLAISLTATAFVSVYLFRQQRIVQALQQSERLAHDTLNELHRQQEALQELNQTLESRVAQRTSELQDLYDHAPIGYFSLNNRGQMVHVNVTFLQWMGYTFEEVIGRSLLEFVTQESWDVFTAAFPETVRRRLIRDWEFTMIRKDGSHFPVLLSSTAVYDERGVYLYSRTAIIDNTERKQAEETLRFANEELVRASRSKDEFLANMSHELRTPINAILAFSESLLEQMRGPINERQRSALSTIDSSGRHLLALINDILDLSKVEAGRLELQRETILVHDVCQASLIFVKEMAHKKQIQVTFTSDDPSVRLYADMKRIKQSLVNLLSNAVKFTPMGGKVDLIVHVEPDAGRLHLMVQDTGIGIASDQVSRLFLPFTQLDSSLNRHHEGTGLGLALVRRLMDLHGGSITVESEVDRGSRFTLTLPYTPFVRSTAAPTPTQHPPTHADATTQVATDVSPTQLSDQGTTIPSRTEPIHILIAEDNEANILALTDYLDAKGYPLLIAHNGREAIEQAQITHPDIILMDIQMPEMDGLEATRRIRQISDLATTPIIAVTALAMPGDDARCIEAGANMYLTKPVNLKSLEQLIRQLVQGQA